GQKVKTEVPRAAEAGLYTWGDKGRLCTLVHAQLLVRVQHADVAPGANSQSGCASGARAVPRTAVPSNLIVQ
ncbi:hypothetical protein POSPLADRAFT_1155454, partial [Postia placenta MAD-698-R-SB12]